MFRPALPRSSGSGTLSTTADRLALDVDRLWSDPTWEKLVGTSVRFLGASAFDITTASGTRVLIDPYLGLGPTQMRDFQRVDLILITHGAWDHYGSTAEIARQGRAQILAGGEVIEALRAEGIPEDRLLATAWGLTVDFRGVRIRSIPSHHVSRTHLPDGRWTTGSPMGFLVDVPPHRIYHLGDTALFSDLRLFAELYHPTIGLVHVSLPLELSVGDARVVTGELTPDEAVLASRWLNLRYVLPCHHRGRADPNFMAFISAYENQEPPGQGQLVVLDAGDTWQVPEGSAPVSAAKRRTRF
jgi:L-ascorbate metabolism protein UlaG (beta-lactamase superfamily)